MWLLTLIPKYFKSVEGLNTTSSVFKVVGSKVIYTTPEVYYETAVDGLYTLEPLYYDTGVFAKVFKPDSRMFIKNNQLIVDGYIKLQPKEPIEIEERTFVLNEPVCVYTPEELHDYLDKVAFAVSKDSTALNMNHVLLETHDGYVRMVSTDGFRMSIVDTKSTDKDINVLLNYKAVQLLKNVVKKTQNDILLFVEDKWIVFKIDSRILAFPSGFNTFPEYERVLTKINKTAAVELTDEFRTAFAELSKLAKTDAVQIHITSSSVVVKYATETLEYEREVSKLITGAFNDYILVNPVFVNEVLLASKGGGKLWLHSDSNPLLFEFDGEEYFQHILMPIRKF